MAKNTKNTETVDITSGEKTLVLNVKRYIPTVRIDGPAVAQLFGLMFDPKTKKLTYYATKGEAKGNPVEIAASTAKDWAKLPGGWNRGNRPIDPKHVRELAELMADGSYFAWAGNMLVISVDPHYGGKSMCNSQHTCAAYAVALSSGQLDDKYVKGIELILVSDFTDDIVDLLDNAKQRTTADGLARRGLAEERDAKIVQGVARFLTNRYKFGKTPLEAKDKQNLIDQVHSVANDARYQPIQSVLSCLAAMNRKDNGKGKAVKGSVGSMTKKFNPAKPDDYNKFGLPYVWWTLAGVILINGGQCDPAEYAAWCHKLAYNDDTTLNPVEMSLRETLERHGKQDRPGTSGHWHICQCLIHAFGVAHQTKMPKKIPNYTRNGESIIEIIEAAERAKNIKANTPASVGMFWQGSNDEKNGGEKGDELPELLPFIFGETEVDAEMMEDESDE